MASSKHPHQMPLTEYIEWARSKIFIPDGRISRQGVAEVRRDLISRVGYLRRTDDEQKMQEVIELLNPNRDLTTEAVAQLETVAKNTIESIAEKGAGTEMATETETTKDLELMQGIANIASSPEGRAALNKSRAGAPLSPREREIVDAHNALLKQHNEIADAERAGKGGGWMKTTRPHYISPEFYRIQAIKDPRERAHAIRAEKSRLRDDPKSPFSDTAHPDHASAVNWMDRLYRAEAELPQPEEEK
jgi:hypothetical protein